MFKKYRIVKRTDVLYDPKIPERIYWYVIQRRMCFWIPIWMDMHFNDYPNSIMNFDDIEKARKYLRKIEILEIQWK